MPALSRSILFLSIVSKVCGYFASLPAWIALAGLETSASDLTSGSLGIRF